MLQSPHKIYALNWHGNEKLIIFYLPRQTQWKPGDTEGCLKWTHHCGARHSPAFQRALGSPTWIRAASGRAFPLHHWIQSKDFTGVWQPAKKGNCLWARDKPERQPGDAGECQGESPVVQMCWTWTLGSHGRQAKVWGSQRGGCWLGIPGYCLTLQGQGWLILQGCQEGCKERGRRAWAAPHASSPQAAQHRLN